MSKLPNISRETQTEINRRLWLDALRSNKFEQAHYSLFESDTGHYCAIGVAARVLNIPSMLADLTYDEVAFATNSPIDLIQDVVRMNDSLLSFSAIARHLEKYWYSGKSLGT